MSRVSVNPELLCWARMRAGIERGDRAEKFKKLPNGRAAMEGQIGFREAYQLTGLRGGPFQDYADRLNIGLR